MRLTTFLIVLLQAFCSSTAVRQQGHKSTPCNNNTQGSMKKAPINLFFRNNAQHKSG